MICKLNHIIDHIRSDTLEDSKLQMVSKLLIEFDFYDELEHDKTSSFSENELLKFLSMGWYIYTNLKNT